MEERASGALKREASSDAMIPRVTVCLLSYNSGGLAEAALESIVRTNYPNLEIVCVDDHSTDGSDESLNRLAKLLNAEFIRNPKNLGIAASCNIALARATGKYFIVFGDDLMMKNRIRGDVEILESHQRVSFVCSRLHEVDGEGNTIDSSRNLEPRSLRRVGGVFRENVVWVWFRGSRILTPTLTFRLSVIKKLGGWDESHKIEDRPLYLKLASHGFIGWFRDEVTTKYRVHQRNYSRKFRQDFVHSELRLLEQNQIRIPNWLSSLKLVLELHHWMSNLGLDQERAEKSLSGGDLGHLRWSLTSSLCKSSFKILSKMMRKRPK